MKNLYFLFSFLLIVNLPINVFSQEEGASDDYGFNPSESEKVDGFRPGWAIGIKASTLGFGGEVVKSFTKRISLRLGGSYFKYDVSDLIFKETDVVGSTTVGAISLIADWNFVNFMHLSGGILYNMSEVDATEDVYEGSFKVGEINYNIKPNEICPYFGLGFGRSISKSKIVSFNFDFGLVYQGVPKLATETVGTIPDRYLEDRVNTIEQTLNNFLFYPFINFQLSFRIF